MKLQKSLLLFGASALLLMACGDAGTDTIEQPTDATEQTEEVDTDEVDIDEDAAEELDEAIEEDSLEQQVGDVIEAEAGSGTIIGQVENINETISSGPIDITLKHAQLSNFNPTADYVDMFGGEDLVLITFQIDVENTGEDTISIYPDQATAVTNNGNQVNSDIFLSDDVGGDFYGGVTKSGDVFFLYEGQAEDVSSVRYIIDSAHDENFENYGEEIEFNVNF